jgi:TM2 domain-containing membrane protein YozV
LLSIFFGVFGADQFYLGFVWPHGILKLFTLGGMGIWWIFDIVRIGSSPVYAADDFRVAANVSHWAYVLAVITTMGLIGLALSIFSINRQRALKAREILLLQAEWAQLEGQPAATHKSAGTNAFASTPVYSAAVLGYGATAAQGTYPNG